MKVELRSQKGRERERKYRNREGVYMYIRKIGKGMKEKIYTQRERGGESIGSGRRGTRKECTEQNVNKFVGSCNVR